MDTKADTGAGLIDTVKLLLALLILFAGIVGYYYYADESVLLRAVGLLVALAIAVWVALQSAQGQTLWKFVQGSRVELRKVVWPTREETVQTTLIVMLFASIMGVFFWLLDLFLLWFTSLVTGQGS
jgi:preprotein translocase subunit SecE